MADMGYMDKSTSGRPHRPYISNRQYCPKYPIFVSVFEKFAGIDKVKI